MCTDSSTASHEIKGGHDGIGRFEGVEIVALKTFEIQF
jgi:hypothetical protein